MSDTPSKIVSVFRGFTVLAAFGLMACSGGDKERAPELRADETWEYMKEVREKPLAPEALEDETIEEAADLPPAVGEGTPLAAEQAQAQLIVMEGRFEGLESEISGFTRELGQSLKKTRESEDELRREEYWRGSQLSLSRLADRQASLESLVRDCSVLRGQLPEASGLDGRLDVLLQRSANLSERTRELITTAEKQLADLKQ